LRPSSGAYELNHEGASSAIQHGYRCFISMDRKTDCAFI